MSEQEAKISQKSSISSIWLLPIIAGLIGIWLIFKAFTESGVDVVVVIDSADGIVAGQTEVKFKGFPIGLVKELEISNDLTEVHVTIELKREAKKHLSENTLFWLVKPEISLSGISGLDTVITGNYFEMLPVDGKKSIRKYKALKEPPPESEDSPGLHLALHAKDLGSISHGSGVYYKQIKVGAVYGYDFAEGGTHIIIKILIDEEYADLVKLNTRFWNASGVELKGDLSGFKVRTQSFAAVIEGGIAFYSPEMGDKETEVENFTEFPLYEGFDEAQAGIKVTMNFPRNSGIKAGITKVIFEGVEVGLVEDFTYNQALGSITATVILDPRLEQYLTSGLDFWLVKPKVSLSGISNVESLLSGVHIAFRLGEGEPTREFDVMPSAPPLKLDENGLHLTILADSVDSLSFGSPVFYKNLQVGTVQDHKLTEDQRRFMVHVFIEPDYEQLVNSSSVFYEQGGVEFSGSLKAFTVKTSPLQSLLAGGVAFHTGSFKDATKVDDGAVFELNSDLETALNTEIITVDASYKYELVPGITKLMYGEKHIGTVKDVKPSLSLTTAIVTIGYNTDFKGLFTENSKVWVVEPQLSSGNTEGLTALISGIFLQVKPAQGKPKDHFKLLNKAPASVASDEGFQIRFTAKEIGSAEKGSPITFKRMVIGEIDSIGFNENNNIELSATIFNEYKHLVTNKSQFYQSSGIRVQGNLTGITVQTDSLQTIIRGGIAIDNRLNDSGESTQAEEMSYFILHRSYDTMNQSGKEVIITFQEVIDIKENATVQYKGHIVGNVIDVRLNPDLTATILTVNLSIEHPQLFQENTKFWLVKPIISMARVANAKAYFTGNYLGVLPGDGSEKNEFIGLVKEPALNKLPNGLNLVLRSKTRGSINVNNPIYYRQVKVGRVLGVELNEDSDGVLIYININPQQSHLVRKNTKFFNASGIKVDAGIFSGVQVDTASIETILAGGIAFLTPEENDKIASDGQSFKLNKVADEDWLDWQPKLKKPDS